jgi:hypothetical protein
MISGYYRKRPEKSSPNPQKRDPMKLVRPIPILRIEGALVFAASLAVYQRWNGDWRVFALLFFVPDVSILPYIFSSAAGWVCYNTVHSYTWPVLLACAAGAHGPGALLTAALIWCAHISWDRLCGFGLKEGEDFWVTHLGVIEAGRALWMKITGPPESRG